MIARVICWFRGHQWVTTHKTVPYGWEFSQRCKRCMQRGLHGGAP